MALSNFGNKVKNIMLFAIERNKFWAFQKKL
jgi:hypothetical protein